MTILWVRKITENQYERSWDPVEKPRGWVIVPDDLISARPGIDYDVLPETEEGGNPTISRVTRTKSPGELAAEAAAATRTAIHAAYPVDAEIKLLNAAIEALIDGKQPPQEYLDYRDTVKQIREEKAP